MFHAFASMYMSWLTYFLIFEYLLVQPHPQLGSRSNWNWSTLRLHKPFDTCASFFEFERIEFVIEFSLAIQMNVGKQWNNCNPRKNNFINGDADRQSISRQIDVCIGIVYIKNQSETVNSKRTVQHIELPNRGHSVACNRGASMLYRLSRVGNLTANPNRWQLYQCLYVNMWINALCDNCWLRKFTMLTVGQVYFMQMPVREIQLFSTNFTLSKFFTKFLLLACTKQPNDTMRYQ
jgi:hypothetical protein